MPKVKNILTFVISHQNPVLVEHGWNLCWFEGQIWRIRCTWWLWWWGPILNGNLMDIYNIHWMYVDLNIEGTCLEVIHILCVCIYIYIYIEAWWCFYFTPLFFGVTFQSDYFWHGLRPNNHKCAGVFLVFYLVNNHWITGWWFQIFFYFHPYLGKISNLTNIFQMGWTHQPDHHLGKSLYFVPAIDVAILSLDGSEVERITATERLPLPSYSIYLVKL